MTEDGGRDGAAWTPGAGPALVIGLLLLALLAGLVVMDAGEAQRIAFAVVAVFAAIGISVVLAAAAGFAHFGSAGRRRAGFEAAAAEAAGEALAVTDAEGRLVYANPRYRSLAGAAATPPPPSTFVADLPEAAARLGKAAGEAARGRTGAADILLRDASGAEAAYRLVVTPAGRGLRVWRFAEAPVAAADDAERAFLRLQQAVTFLDRAPIGFVAFDGEGQIDLVNATLADWVGLDLGDTAAGGLRIETVLGDGPARALAEAARAGGGPPASIESELARRDGRRMAVRILAATAPDRAGGAPGVQAIVLPAAVAAPAQPPSERRFARFFDSAPVAIAGIDAGGAVARANPVFGRLFGTGAERALRLADAVADTDRGAVEAAVAAAAAGAAAGPVDAAIAGEGGRSVRIYLAPVREAGDAEIAIAYVLDTTEQRALEARFAQSQKMQAVGQLAGGVAHDFNNLLTAIIGFADLVLTRYRPSDPFFQDIMAIKQNAHRAAGLVGQLLAFSRRQTMRPERIVLNDVLADLTILLDRLLGERVELKVVHGRDLWPVMADVNQFEQVVVNLAVNARDAMPDGGLLTIRSQNVGAADAVAFEGAGIPPADYVLTEISDTGRGMPAAVMEQIFEPFFTTKERGKGTGLGLSTVYGIVKQSGGYITVESAPGQGTTFRVLLPRAPGVAAPALEPPRPSATNGAGPLPIATGVEPSAEALGPAAAEAPEKPAAPDLTGNATILLVEDEDAVRAFASRALASRGYTVHQAASGAEALKVMEECGGDIDLVVSDVVMPEMDGPTLMRELRRARPELRIIFVSGYAEDAFARNLPENESFSFLPKPFTLKQLATAVKQVLES